MKWLDLLTWLNVAIVAVMTAAYFYQGVYTLVGLFRRRARRLPEPAALHRFAALICARNEEGVVGELVESLLRQDYPARLLDIYVMADNCTDGTARAARAAGARVYARRDERRVGKGYALDHLLERIRADEGENAYDGFFIFDADNLVDPGFVRAMNAVYDTGRYDAVTCYRNSKNFGVNWITAGYSVWFLREARFLNHPRMLLGTSCAVSGTGFLVSAALVRENGGWPFHLLTEDIEFSVSCALAGRRIGYCHDAVVYDEQPTTFAQSWKQRLRWSKGFFQVDRRYLLPLLRGALCRRGARLSCYDMCMTVAPCMFLTFGVLLVNTAALLAVLTQPGYLAHLILRRALRYVAAALVNFYLGMLLYGVLTVLSEWRRIPARAWEKLRYLPMFPVFMATYIPVTFAALVRRVSWDHIAHHSSAELAVAARRAG